MSWSEPRLSRTRRVLLGAGLAAGLAACGFTPLYAPGAGGDRLRGALAVQEPATRADYAFATRVEERLGLAPNGPYRLRYQITETTEDQGITPDQSIQRIALLGALDYVVEDAAGGRVLTSGRVTAFTGYNTTGTTVATSTAETDAERRLMVMLADRVVEDLTLSADGWLP